MSVHILGFEPFDAGSHRATREQISRCSSHQWTWLTRPGRAWKWRMRTAALELAGAVQRKGIDPETVDALFVTSLMSASDLRGLLPAAFRTVPLIVYMHENQAAYPSGEHGDDPRDAHFLLTNLTSAAAADRVIFNSRWNKTSFFVGVHELLAHQRDGQFYALLESIERKSRVIWPPVEPPPQTIGQRLRTLHNPVRIVWPHRWEHDKGPDVLLQTARQYGRSHNLRWIILGERYERIPTAIQTFQTEFTDAIDHCGYVESRDAYWQWLGRADWVLSTARHEFFGIAVVEAMLAGALPWLPPSLSYPELLPEGAQGLSPMHPPGDPAAVRSAIGAHLEPALAMHAVQRLDDAVADVVANA